jgi:hypothetical protein
VGDREGGQRPLRANACIPPRPDRPVPTLALVPGGGFADGTVGSGWAVGGDDHARVPSLVLAPEPSFLRRAAYGTVRYRLAPAIGRASQGSSGCQLQLLGPKSTGPPVRCPSPLPSFLPPLPSTVVPSLWPPLPRFYTVPSHWLRSTPSAGDREESKRGRRMAWYRAKVHPPPASRPSTRRGKDDPTARPPTHTHTP